ncbi:MAG TPA: ribbon-helix-helix domain-containing protein [Alphaproteobacteria bacterium]|nr:ribbon-helix-helix domain-containing protein [Alphaproteobacteria bacterium]
MSTNPEEARFHKRSVSLHGHKTSVSLEKAFWDVLEESSQAQDISLSQLIKDIDKDRPGSLSSALRLYALDYVQK